MRLRTIVSLCLAATFLVLITGCGPAEATVSGIVTVDGKPAELGAITYTSADEIKGTATADIKDGKYEIKTVVGKKNVRISALKIIRRQKESEAPDSPMVDITEEILPARFNSESTLEFEVKPGPNTKDWQLDTKDSKR